MSNSGQEVSRLQKEFELSVNYEMALDWLGERLQPFMQAILEEKKKPAPSQPLIDYCRAQMTVIANLKESLSPKDEDTIERILNKNDPVFFRK